MASIRIGSVFGIPIKLGVSFLLVVPLLAFIIGSQIEITVELLNGLFDANIDPEPLTGEVTPWLLGLAAALGLFGSVLLHELGHSLVARRFGLDTEAITLWFLGGLAQFETMPEEWRREFAIAVAGPIVSVAIGIACFVAFVSLPAEFPAALFVLGYLAVLNVALAVFNMLPGFPMDGGRVLRALLSRNRSRVEATRIAAGVGKAFALVLGIAGILVFSIFWIAIAFFIYLAATAESRQVVIEAAFEGLSVGEIMTPAADLKTVTPETAIEDLLDRMLTERHTGYPVVDDADEDVGRGVSGVLVGIVTLEDVQERERLDRDRDRDQVREDVVTVRDVMSTDLVTVSPETEASTALRTLQREGVGRILVTENDDLVGLISRTDLMTILEITQTTRSTDADIQSIEP